MKILEAWKVLWNLESPGIQENKYWNIKANH
jgi:hypothetical protein